MAVQACGKTWLKTPLFFGGQDFLGKTGPCRPWPRKPLGKTRAQNKKKKARCVRVTILAGKVVAGFLFLNYTRLFNYYANIGNLLLLQLKQLSRFPWSIFLFYLLLLTTFYYLLSLIFPPSLLFSLMKMCI